jgi:hypothetical protein
VVAVTASWHYDGFRGIQGGVLPELLVEVAQLGADLLEERPRSWEKH